MRMIGHAYALKRALALFALTFTAFGLSACAGYPDEGFTPIARADAPYFDPITFFTGTTQGTGTLDKGVLGEVPIRVESFGEVSTTGLLTVTQDIYEGDKPKRTRTWTMRRKADGLYEASLTDAMGAVELWTKGNMLTIRYTAEDSMVVTQRLTLSKDGQRATGAIRIDVLGARFAVVTEEIVRVE